MEYKKNLIILTGERGKCAVTVETTSKGAICRLSVKSETGERLYLAVKDKPKKFVGPVESAIKLPFEPSRNAHYAVISSRGLNVVLYGTLSSEKLWPANMTDGVMNEVESFEKKFAAIDAPSVVAQIKTEKVKTEVDYDDEAIAEADYYPSEYRRMNTQFADYNVNKKSTSSEKNTVGNRLRSYLAGYNAKLKGVGTANEHNAVCGIFSLQRKFILEKDRLSILQSYRGLDSYDFTNNRFLFGKYKKTDKTAYNTETKINGRQTEKSNENVQREPVKAVKIEAQKPKTVTFAKNSINVPVVNADFYDRIKPKLDKLFERGERYEKLEREMPLTKWVKIPYEKSGYYVVGIIGDKPDYVCYGVPGTYSPDPPEELGKNCKWLPFDVSRPQEQGLWLLYQDARTGKSVQNPQ